MLDMSVSIFMCESIRPTCHADGSMLLFINNFKVENFASSCSKKNIEVDSDQIVVIVHTNLKMGDTVSLVFICD